MKHVIERAFRICSVLVVEDQEIDRLIRKYGYRTTPEIMRFVDEDEDLKNNLSAAAHLIGITVPTEKRRYCLCCCS